MKRIIVMILVSLLLVACDKTDPVYEAINPANEDINSASEYLELIDVAISMEYRYFTFIDLRSESDFQTSRIRHFKNCIPFTTASDSAKEELLDKVDYYQLNGYIVLISYEGDNVSSDAAKFLNENGYNNVKVLTMGFEGFETSLEEEGYKTTTYIDKGDCGC